MADAVFVNRAAVLAKLAKIPDVCQAVAATSLDVATDDLVAALQRAAPVDNAGHDPHPGLLREAIAKTPTPGRQLSWRIMSSARDAAGRLFGAFVEFGHGAAGPRPFWYPTYRAWKKPMRARLFGDTRKALKAYWPD